MSDHETRLVAPVSDEQIGAMIRAAFGPQAVVVTRRFIATGHFNTSYELQTADPAHHVVLRIAPPPDRPLFRFERTILSAEPLNYARIRAAGVPTAEVLAQDCSCVVIDRHFLVIKFIDAVSMNHASVPADARPPLRRQLGAYMARLHAQTDAQFGWPLADGSIRGSARWSDVFGELLTETCDKARAAGVLSAADYATALECYAGRRAVFDECRTPAFVHTDIWDPNVLVRQTDGVWQIAALIDADHAFFAEPEFEFALWDAPDEHLLAGYGRPLDLRPSAVLRRTFYRFQLYLIYAWFYLVMTPNPAFQPEAQRIALETLQELVGKPA